MKQESTDQELQNIIASFEKKKEEIPVFTWVMVTISALGTFTAFAALVYFFILKPHVL